MGCEGPIARKFEENGKTYTLGTGGLKPVLTSGFSTFLREHKLIKEFKEARVRYEEMDCPGEDRPYSKSEAWEVAARDYGFRRDWTPELGEQWLEGEGLLPEEVEEEDEEPEPEPEPDPEPPEAIVIAPEVESLEEVPDDIRAMLASSAWNYEEALKFVGNALAYVEKHAFTVDDCPSPLAYSLLEWGRDPKGYLEVQKLIAGMHKAEKAREKDKNKKDDDQRQKMAFVDSAVRYHRKLESGRDSEE